ncbi:DNA glycosylase AlkZ-like family protein [uncultured Draconibacterium sp.]|uniref:winged helix-turn-helix domain-containing protein n=1 Tax=uncultured Draconibacterium sp. TaxID=1573823 RepID=UPI0029C907CD|nr:crosslink repair DNA glycosylase YcaQ family protein [uncultured Draconibacterium sp.]
MKEYLSISQLRSLTLESQGLTKTFPFGTGKGAVLNALEHLGYLQIDTLAVVERAHHHTLWTRNPDYKAEYLDELVKERKVFEYWFHAASYLPMKDFRYALPQMSAIKRDASHYYNADPKVMKYVMDTIRAEGSKKARDFQSESKKTGEWGSWNPTKIAIERLFLQGDIMICERNGMQKTYNITERVLPKDIDLTEPDSMEFTEYLVKTYLRAYGFTTVKQITHLKKGEKIRKDVNEVLKVMLEEGLIQKMNIEGMPSVFIQSHLTKKVLSKKHSHIRFLSPFDNSIIHRDRIEQLFNFEYRLECYTPKEKRRYGYFCLPILFGDTFIGRMDCKAHRKEKRFEIIHLHIENQNIAIELWAQPFVEELKRFTSFNGCKSFILTKVSPQKLTDTLKHAIKNHGK